MRVLGIKRIDFTDNSGRAVKGLRFYASQPMVPSRGEGVEVISEFIGQEKMEAMGIQLELGMDIELNYNKRGRLIGIRVLEDYLEVE